MESQFPSNSMQDSSFTIPNLPSELIIEIFLRLPVKSLVRYRSISKYLLDLISSPEFIKSHLSLSTSNTENSQYRLPCKLPMHFSIRSLRYDSDLHIPINKSYGVLLFLGSVNGLICLTSLVSLVGRKRYLFLWNPSIRKYWKLPSFGTGLRDVSKYCFGFIYDEFRDDYKVVAILFNNFRNFEVKMYSLMSNSWKSVDNSCRPREIFRNVSGKFVNGKLHWVTSCNIFSIDMSDEKWESIEKPSNGEGDFISELEVLGSNLSVLCYNREKYVSIWVMKEYGVKESWIMMYNINDVHNLYLPHFMLKNGDILAGLARYFKIYNPKDDWFSPNIINFDFDQDAAEIYVESLVSPFPSEGRTSNATKIRRKRLRSSRK